MPTQRPVPGKTHMLKARLIRRARNSCAGCGYRFPANLHPHQLARQDGAFEIDHKVPLARGGTNDYRNLQVLCLPCHDGKTNADGKFGPMTNMTDREWRQAGRPQNWERKRSLVHRRGARSVARHRQRRANRT